MKRRTVLQTLAALPFASPFAAGELRRPIGLRRSRVRPGGPGWPSAAQWAALGRQVGGQLIRVHSPFQTCERAAADRTCRYAIEHLHDPYYLRDEPGLTQLSGYAGAWMCAPSVYAVRARNAADIAAAVRFARDHRVLPVIKGGGHGYQGTSNAADSLLIWTRALNAIALHEQFVPNGGSGVRPQRAVEIGAGSVCMDAYHAVTTVHGAFVQGSGCATVGVPGLAQSGGFGSFSKRYGTTASTLLQAEVVTADGRIRIVNAYRDPDLFWALKGGGGGTFGVVSRVWLRVSELPEYFGPVSASITAHSDEAFRTLIDRITLLCRDHLINPHWGEQIRLRPDRTVQLRLVSSGLTRAHLEKLWHPFFAWVKAAGPKYQLTHPPLIATVPARRWWDPTFWSNGLPGVMTVDPRRGAPPYHAWWTGDGHQAGSFLYGYGSLWLPRALLEEPRRQRLVEALFKASRRWEVALHLNKGLAGASSEVLEAARNTATNPAVLDAFALAILGAGGPSAYPGLPGAQPDFAAAQRQSRALAAALEALRRAVPRGGSYVAESDYFQKDWSRAFWGAHYPRLLAVKMKYDPEGLFFVHHGVGSEYWSADGFTPVRGR